jgi:hypothetical protein
VLPIAQGVAFAKALLGARFHALAGAGHYLHHEQPQLVAEILRSFLFAVDVERVRLQAPVRRAALPERTLSLLRAAFGGAAYPPTRVVPGACVDG